MLSSSHDSRFSKWGVLTLYAYSCSKFEVLLKYFEKPAWLTEMPITSSTTGLDCTLLAGIVLAITFVTGSFYLNSVMWIGLAI